MTLCRVQRLKFCLDRKTLRKRELGKLYYSVEKILHEERKRELGELNIIEKTMTLGDYGYCGETIL